MKVTWEDVKAQIRSELPQSSFSLWINPLTIAGTEKDQIVLTCPNKFSKRWVTENYKAMIQEKFQLATESDREILFRVEPPKRKDTLPSLLADTRQLMLLDVPGKRKNGRVKLNSGYTFDRFVVGRSNEFAYSASKALAQGGAWNYHSLLMLANTGLGKSHLSHAAGNAILEQNPSSRVYYMTAEDFTNEMVSSLKQGRIESFKSKYRNACDVLLLEEIQFLSGKEKTQLELGYTLDALANDNKKLIFTSSLAPKDIPRMSEQLTSRLTSGLITTINHPDYETRLKILRAKAKEQNLSLEDDILALLASSLSQDVRLLESALKCLKAKSELLKARIDKDLAREVLRCLVAAEQTIDLKEIEQLVCRYYKIEREMLRSSSRKKIFTYPRNIYLYLCRHHTDETVESIAGSVRRSHSTALYASEVIEHKIKSDPKVRNQVRFLSQKIQEMSK
ncbi:MAG: chromosomal replication initiator protein DnaA [Desulfatiglandaceae bacterium]|jgi:chromosomal replication initiator protein